MKKIYLDACVAIYLIEKHPQFGKRVEALFERLDANASLCYSPLSRMECMVMPLRKQDHELLTNYQLFFAEQEMLIISEDRFNDAAQLRADFRSLKTPDSLHIATALYHNCHEFWTNDDRLNSVAPDIVRNILNEN